jgi:type II secretory pathway component PulF
MTDDPAPKANPRSWGTALFAALYLATLAGILMKIVPQFDEVYRHVKVPMPGLTLILVSISHAACAVPWLVYPMLVVLPAPLCRLDKRQAAVAQTLISIGYAVSVVGILVALFFPLLSVDYGIGARRH